jgi:hypothetical protein
MCLCLLSRFSCAYLSPGAQADHNDQDYATAITAAAAPGPPPSSSPTTISDLIDQAGQQSERDKHAVFNSVKHVFIKLLGDRMEARQVTLSAVRDLPVNSAVTVVNLSRVLQAAHECAASSKANTAMLSIASDKLQLEMLHGFLALAELENEAQIIGRAVQALSEVQVRRGAAALCLRHTKARSPADVQ